MTKFKDMTIRKKLIIVFSILTAGLVIAFIASVATLEASSFRYGKMLESIGYDAAAIREYQANIHGNLIFLIVFLVVFFIVAETIVVRTIKSIRVSITELKKAVELVAQGDVDVQATKFSNDEVGQLADATNTMIAAMKEQADIARRVADGDLTVKITPRSDKDVLNLAIAQLVSGNNQTLSEMKVAAGQVSDGSDQVAAASQALAQGSTEQASAITQITASIEDIANRTKVNASDAENANNLVITAKNDAILSNERMNDMIDAMSEINQSSENISKIIKVIDDIAFQTNILALNAAVEAARAGAHGKGFGVVAEEVRNLAGKSAQAASETADLIENSIQKVSKGSKLAEETAESLKQMMTAIDQVAAITGSIADASNEQATAVAQIDQAIGQVSIVVQNNSSTSEECAAASEELSAQALKLKEMIGYYKLNEGESSEKPYSKKANTDRRAIERREKAQPKAAPMIEQKEDELVISLDDGFGKY